MSLIIRSSEGVVKFDTNDTLLRFRRKLTLHKVSNVVGFPESRYAYFDTINTYSKDTRVFYSLPLNSWCFSFWGTSAISIGGYPVPRDTKLSVWLAVRGSNRPDTITVDVYDRFLGGSKPSNGFIFRNESGEVTLTSETPVVNITDSLAGTISPPTPTDSPRDGPVVSRHVGTGKVFDMVTEPWRLDFYYYSNGYYDYMSRNGWMMYDGNNLNIRYIAEEASYMTTSYEFEQDNFNIIVAKSFT